MTSFFRGATVGVTYVRCDLPARHLPGQVRDLSDHVTHLGDGTFAFDHTDTCSVWSFPGNQLRGMAMEAQRKQGQRVLVEVDDLYLRLAPQTLTGQQRPWQNKVDFEGDRHSVQAHTLICRTLADGIIVSTPRLAREYREVNRHVYECANTADPDDWLYEKTDDGIFRVGFAGSISHMADMPLVLPALEWASKQEGVEVLLIGSIGEHVPYARHVKWTETLADYRESLFQLDVGLCPLKPGQWSDCKSDVKAMEYTMAGALPVVSQVEAYRPWIKHDSPALGAASGRDFTKHVKWCVNNKDQVKALAAECKAKVLRERTIKGNIWRWQEAIEGGS